MLSKVQVGFQVIEEIANWIVYQGGWWQLLAVIIVIQILKRVLFGK